PREQPLFGLWRRDARQRPDFRVRELAARQRPGQPRQRGEGARHADALAGRASVEAYTPREPLGARAEAGVPAGARVELADELEKPRGRRIEVRRELSDLVAQPLELGGAGESSSRRCHNIDVRTTGDVRGSSRSCKADSAPRIIASATRRLSVATMFDWPRTTPVAR